MSTYARVRRAREGGACGAVSEEDASVARSGAKRKVCGSCNRGFMAYRGWETLCVKPTKSAPFCRPTPRVVVTAPYRVERDGTVTVLGEDVP